MAKMIETVSETPEERLSFLIEYHLHSAEGNPEVGRMLEQLQAYQRMEEQANHAIDLDGLRMAAGELESYAERLAADLQRDNARSIHNLAGRVRELTAALQAGVRETCNGTGGPVIVLALAGAEEAGEQL